ncbi:hypothetical protein [Salipaludibacillus aurantiacus]|uniref:Uncharacterized protein n=1 Tax=Salipaludibacillus aurantiacus TaxID=1601833 RepID=A0A1H9U1A1_9BACI|nr:hypothetical protein [Salipaludibacillus aurantiacus]SES02853.1 hypothetical protein SAMN05518684_106210 [Salipaludibacillus aurantiacus]
MTKKELEEMISDYRLYKREIERLNDLVYGIGVGLPSRFGNAGVAAYGVEATMPRGSSGISKSELDKLDKRERKLLYRIQGFQDKVEFVEAAEEMITDPVQQIVFSCMMEGLSYRAIGKHAGVSREQVRRLKDDVLCHLCQNDHLCQNWQYLKYQKQTV